MNAMQLRNIAVLNNSKYINDFYELEHKFEEEAKGGKFELIDVMNRDFASYVQNKLLDTGIQCLIYSDETDNVTVRFSWGF